MEKRYNLIRKTLLLSILPLLTGTEDLISALLFSGVLLVIALIVRIIAIYTKNFFDKKAKWIFLWGIGFSLTNFLYIVLPEFFTVLTDYSNFYILLIGVSPMVYANCKDVRWTKFFKEISMFFFLMLFIGLSREFLGKGSILTYSLIANSPLELMSDPAGAFLMLGFSGFILEIVCRYLNIPKTDLNLFKEQKEREVSR